MFEETLAKIKISDKDTQINTLTLLKSKRDQFLSNHWFEARVPLEVLDSSLLSLISATLCPMMYHSLSDNITLSVHGF